MILQHLSETLQSYGGGLGRFSGSFKTLPLTDAHSGLNVVFVLCTSWILVGARGYGTGRT